MVLPARLPSAFSLLPLARGKEEPKNQPDLISPVPPLQLCISRQSPFAWPGSPLQRCSSRSAHIRTHTRAFGFPDINGLVYQTVNLCVYLLGLLIIQASFFIHRC